MAELAVPRPLSVRRSLAIRPVRLAAHALLLALAATMILPFLWTLATSLKTDEYLLTLPPRLVPRPVTLESYRELAQLLPVPRLVFNSLVVAVVGTLGQLLTSAMAAYAFARIRFPGREALFILYLATMMVPFQVTVVPLFILMARLGWLNSYQALIAPALTSAFGTFLLRQHFLTLPRELDEAALIEGASHWTIFWRIALPLAKPALAAFGIFAFMASWNAFLWPLFVVRDATVMTLPVGLATLQGRYTTEWNLVMAGTVVTLLPMLAVYLFAQRYFQESVTLSGLKG